MRSLILTLALGVPCAMFAVPCAASFAATPAETPADNTRPIVTLHTARTQYVLLTFHDTTAQQRTLQVGDRTFRLHYGQTLNAAAPMGSVVRIYSDQNSTVNGQQLMQVGTSDGQRIINVR